MGRDSVAGELREGPFIQQALSLRKTPSSQGTFRRSQSMHDAIRPQSALRWGGSSFQRLGVVGLAGGGVGSGKGEAAAAAAVAFGGFGLFGFGMLFWAAFGGGLAG